MSEKQDALKSALAQIEKNFGKGSIMTMDEKNGTQNLPSYSTGSLKLDKALGVNGIPRGRIVEIYGPESSGKTTLCLETCASVHKEGGTVLYVDTEHALDPTYAEKLGVNLEELMLSQPDTGEQALEIVDTMTRSGAVDFIVVDSVAALTPKAEIEGDMGDSHVGLQARLMSQALRKLSGLSKKTDTTIMFVNQIRMKIGVMFGSPETTTGGNALKFYSSVRLDIRRIGSVKDMDEVVGNETRVKVAKNKVSPPFKQAEFQIIYNKGINREAELIDLAVDNNIIDKSGSWFKYDGKQIAQGRKNAETYLINHPEFRDMLIEQVLPKSEPESKEQSETDKSDESNKNNNSNKNASKESETQAD